MLETNEISEDNDDTSKSNDKENEEVELEEVLDSVAPEHRKIIEKMMISSVQMRSIASAPEVEVMRKLTPEHISKYLDGAEEEMKNSYAERFHKKVFTFLTMIIAMIFFIVIIIILKETPDIMEKIVYAVGGVIAGAFGGFGLGRKQSDE